MEPIHHVYYYTTTFGSKISDAVYIASLDGYERDEIFNNTARRIYTTYSSMPTQHGWNRAKAIFAG